MATPVIGDVVIVPFPFADLSGVKRRPAVVVAIAERGDVVLCQITSRRWASDAAILLEDADFSSGGLDRASYARPDKLFTASAGIAIRTAGALGAASRERVREAVARLFV